MFSLSEIITLAKRKRLPLFWFVIFNLLVTAFVIYRLNKPSFVAEYHVIQNKVSETFMEDPARDFLFNNPYSLDIISTISSDTLIGKASKTFKIKNRYFLDSEENAVAFIRRSMTIESDNPILSIKLKMNNKDLADSLLNFIIQGTERVYFDRIYDNNRISINNKTLRLRRLQSQLDSVLSVNSQKLSNEKQTFLRSKKLELLEAINRINNNLDELHQTFESSKYRSFYATRLGVTKANTNVVVLIILALVANIIVLIVEFQLLLIFSMIKSRFSD